MLEVNTFDTFNHIMHIFTVHESEQDIYENIDIFFTFPVHGFMV